MPGVRKYRKLQIGRETTAGTAAAATALLRAIGTIEDGIDVQTAEEDVGLLSPVDRYYVASVLGKLSMEPVNATYEQLPYLFEAGIKGVNTGAADGAGSGKIYAYPLATNSTPTRNTYTIEGGDDNQAERMAYCFVDTLKLSGKIKEAVKMSADWQGRQVSTTTYTALGALPSVTEILFQNAKLYLDAVSGTSGTTVVSNSFLAFDMSLKTGVVPQWTGDGQLYYTFTKNIGSELTVDVTFEYDGNAVSEIANWRNKVSRQLAIIVTGPALTTAGTAYTNKTFKIELSGHWDQFSKIGDQDGDDIVTGTFRAAYNGTSGKFATLTVVNELTTLT